MRLRRDFLMAWAAIVLVGSCLTGVWAAKPGGTVNRPISVEWRRDVWQPPEVRLMTESGGSMSTINGEADLVRGGWPRWSPNGQAIAGYYKNLRDTAGNIDDIGLMVMNPDGTNEYPAVTSDDFNFWNAGRAGIRSSYFPVSENYACWCGTDALVFAGYSDYDPSFFGHPGDTSYSTEGWRLFLVNPVGLIVPLTETPIQNAPRYDDFSPHYTATRGKIVFVSNRSGFDELYAINSDGSGLQQITDFQGGITGTLYLDGPVWDPAGNRIVVTVDQGASPHEHDLWILDVDLTKLNPGTGTDGRVTDIDVFAAQGNGISEEMAAWSPTGDRLVFIRWSRPGRAYKFQVVIADANTGTETVIVESTKQGVFYPDWKPVP